MGRFMTESLDADALQRLTKAGIRIGPRRCSIRRGEPDPSDLIFALYVRNWPWSVEFQERPEGEIAEIYRAEITCYVASTEIADWDDEEMVEATATAPMVALAIAFAKALAMVRNRKPFEDADKPVP